jgi:hypothetical protein
MPAHSRSAKKWRRFNRKHGPLIFIVFLVLGVLVLVGLLMYVLTSPDWRIRSSP